MPTLEEITLSSEQNALLCNLLNDIQAAPSELKMLTRLQRHVKTIWNAGYAAGTALSDIKEATQQATDHVSLLNETEKAEVREVLKKKSDAELALDLHRYTDGGLLTIAHLVKYEMNRRIIYGNN